DSQPKIELLLRDLSAGQVRARQVNHPLTDNRTAPIVYALSPLDDDGRCLAQGRDLRAVAALQQRLIEAEQSLERDYAKLRLAETRYRLLLQSIGDAVLTVDASTQKIVEANPAAGRLLGDDPKRLAGRALGESFSAQTSRLVGEWLAGLRTAARPDPRCAGPRAAVLRTGDIPHVPARPAQELADELRAEDVLLAGQRREQRSATDPRRRSRRLDVGLAQLVREILQLLQSERNLDEIAALVFPAHAKVPGHRSQQFEIDGLGIHAERLQASQIGERLGVAATQHDPRQLKDFGGPGSQGTCEIVATVAVGHRAMREDETRNHLAFYGAQQGRVSVLGIAISVRVRHRVNLTRRRGSMPTPRRVPRRLPCTSGGGLASRWSTPGCVAE
ncbi:MAG: PAS domain-containing protein, partial [Gammaproteobacteria bacterium]|nr:PAS domain-containing protein [Gammaproteobacteria bacterium]